MTDAPPPKRPARKKRDWSRIGRALVHLSLAVVRRTYAVAVIALVLWLSFLALRYLVETLILPPPVPPQVVGIPVRLSENVLKTQRAQWPGEVNIENPRAPLAHYHRLTAWIQPDPLNACTQAGCHAPLPHSKRKEVRAFLNLHATSMHCGVCHMHAIARPLPLTWYDLDTGQPRQPPTVLKLYGWLTSEDGRRELAQPTAATQAKLVRLLRAAAREADNARSLVRLAEHVDAERYSSPGFQALVETARTSLPRHFRGEYGAKLALRDPLTNRPILSQAGTESAVRAYLSQAPTAPEYRRKELIAAVHLGQGVPTLKCSDCHRSTGALVDFKAAGYPPVQIEMLTTAPIFRMIEDIARGQPFFLPDFAPPESQPAPPPQ